MVPFWSQDESKPVPRTVQDANFTESRLHSLRTRNAAAYKGIAALVLAGGARDWMEDKALDKVQPRALERAPGRYSYSDLARMPIEQSSSVASRI